METLAHLKSRLLKAVTHSNLTKLKRTQESKGLLKICQDCSGFTKTIWHLEGLISDFGNLFTACFKATCGTHWHTQETYNGKERIERFGNMETWTFCNNHTMENPQGQINRFDFHEYKYYMYSPWSPWFDDFHFHVSLIWWAHGQCTHPFSRCCAAWLTFWVCAINVHATDGGCPWTVLN